MSTDIKTLRDGANGFVASNFGTYLRLTSLGLVVPTSLAVDAANLTAALAAVAGTGAPVIIRPGSLQIGSPVYYPNDNPSTVIGAGIGKTTILSSVDNSQVYNAPIVAYPTYGATTTIAGNVVGGAGKTFTSTTVLALLSWVIIGNAADAGVFQIRGRSGTTGTITYTVHKTILRNFTAGDNLVALTSIPRDITIRDMTVTQLAATTGLRALNFVTAVRVRVVDIAVDDSGGAVPNQGGSFDTCCDDCETLRFRTLAPLSGQAFSGEASDRLRFIDNVTDNCSLGKSVLDCYDVEIRGGSSSGCTGAGIKIGTGSGLTGGSKYVRVIGGQYDKNATGVVLGKGSDYSLDGVQVNDSTSEAFNVGNIETVSSVRLSNCAGRRSGDYNLHVYASSSKTQFTNFTSEGKSGANTMGLLAQGEVQGSGFDSTGDYYPLYLAMSTGGACSIERIRMSSPGVNTGVTLATASRVTLRDAELAGGTSIDHTQASELVLDNVSTASSGGGTRGYVGIAACTLRLYGRCDMSTTETPFTIHASGYVNRSEVATAKRLTLNGATLVSIPFPALKTGEVPKLTCVSKAGTGTGLAPTIALVPGTGFNVPAATQVAGDTSVWDWEV